MKQCVTRRAPHLTAAALGLVFIASGLSACSTVVTKSAAGEGGRKAHRGHHAYAYAAARPARGAPRGCLVPAARRLLAELETQFGAVRVVSTCRRGAVIAGTRRPSQHRYGKAIDFLAPPGRKAEVVRWLREHSPGVTMTYHRMNHIHTDVGHYRRVILDAGGRRSAHRRSRARSAAATQADIFVDKWPGGF